MLYEIHTIITKLYDSTYRNLEKRLYGLVKLSSLNSAGYLEFPDRTVHRGQDLGNNLCLARVLALQISPFKRFGLNL